MTSRGLSVRGFHTWAHIRITRKSCENRLLGPPGVSGSECAFLTRSWVMLMLPVQGSHFENHSSEHCGVQVGHYTADKEHNHSTGTDICISNRHLVKKGAKKSIHTTKQNSYIAKIGKSICLFICKGTGSPGCLSKKQVLGSASGERTWAVGLGGRHPGRVSPAFPATEQ